MAPYDPYNETFSPPISPIKDSFIPRHLHHSQLPAEKPTNEHADTYHWSGPAWFELTMTPGKRNHFSSLPSTPPAKASARSRAQSIRGLPLLSNPNEIRIEDNAADVCPCCHLRRRSSNELHLPKAHTPLDECCGEFCPDLALPDAASPPPVHPHLGHSRLCEEVESPRDLPSDRQARVKAPRVPVKEPLTPQNGQEKEGGYFELSISRDGGDGGDGGDGAKEEDDGSGSWSPRDFD